MEILFLHGWLSSDCTIQLLTSHEEELRRTSLWASVLLPQFHRQFLRFFPKQTSLTIVLLLRSADTRVVVPK